MNTRNSVRDPNNKLNLSRGRGRSTSTPPFSLGNQNPLASKPKVQRSPPTKKITTENRVNNPIAVNLNRQFQDIASASEQLIEHNQVEIIENTSPRDSVTYTSPQLDSSASTLKTPRNLLEASFNTLSQASIEDLLVPCGFIDNQERILSCLNMASNSNNNEDNTRSSSSNVQASSENSIEYLITMLQQTIRSTQDEMRNELTAIKQTISNISQPQGLQTTSTIPFQLSSSASNFSNNAVMNTKLEKWKVNFDGTGSVSDFLFKIDTLCERTQCSHEHLMANFHIFLSGKAENWFWNFIKLNRNSSYPVLKSSITKEFGNLETDHEVLIRISTRKQLAKESYDDFHTIVVSMNSRMREPIAEKTLIDILKRNVHTNLKFMLFNTEPKTLHELRDHARNAEKVLCETKVALPHVNSTRQINEIEAVVDEDVDIDLEVDPQIDAIQIPRRFSKPDYSKIKCWNCLALGHSYIYCPEDTRNLFCFKCGQRGVNTTKCSNPHLGNRTRSEMATGDSRSKVQTPSLH